MKKVLILGASSDIGQELIKILKLSKNLKLILHYNSNKKFFQNYNKNYTLINFNFKNEDIKWIDKKFDNNYDIIINLIGYIDNVTFKKFDYENISESLKINSIIPMIIIKKSLKHMVKKKFGNIVNTSSIGVNFGGGEKTYNYSISKFLNEFIPRDIRKLFKKNIFYNVVKIGFTNTKMHKSIEKKNISKRTSYIPMKKSAQPIDIAKTIHFLISKDNSYINGQIINVSGGE